MQVVVESFNPVAKFTCAIVTASVPHINWSSDVRLQKRPKKMAGVFIVKALLRSFSPWGHVYCHPTTGWRAPPPPPVMTDLCCAVKCFFALPLNTCSTGH